jgi:hypothetical protein
MKLHEVIDAEPLLNKLDDIKDKPSSLKKAITKIKSNENKSKAIKDALASEKKAKISKERNMPMPPQSGGTVINQTDDSTLGEW